MNCQKSHVFPNQRKRQKSFSHVLNTRAVARMYCNEKGLDYIRSTLIVAHLGEEYRLTARGKVVDVVTAEEGPFSPERAGGLQVLTCIEICRRKA